MILKARQILCSWISNKFLAGKICTFSSGSIFIQSQGNFKDCYFFNNLVELESNGARAILKIAAFYNLDKIESGGGRTPL